MLVMYMKQAGVTLIELMVVISLIAIIAFFAIPSFNDLLLTQRARGAAEVLVSSMQNTKAQTIKSNQEVSIVFTPNSVNTDIAIWCYGTTEPGDATCDCSTSPSNCADGSIVSSSDYQNLTLNFNNVNRRTFEPVQGMAANGTQGTAIFDAGNAKSTGVTLSLIGRIRVCVPSGSAISRYDDSLVCP